MIEGSIQQTMDGIGSSTHGDWGKGRGFPPMLEIFISPT